jgi:hypothetical protein
VKTTSSPVDAATRMTAVPSSFRVVIIFIAPVFARS